MAYDLVTEEVSEVLADVSPGSIHADESHLYFSEWGKQTLWRVSLDGKRTLTWAVVPPSLTCWLAMRNSSSLLPTWTGAFTG